MQCVSAGESALSIPEPVFGAREDGWYGSSGSDEAVVGADSLEWLFSSDDVSEIIAWLSSRPESLLVPSESRSAGISGWEGL
jgi:hypothetical protein